MTPLHRSLVLGAAALALATTTASAQLLNRPKELRLDLAALSVQDGSTELGFVLPGTLAIAVYLTDNVAIEASAFLDLYSGEGFRGGEFGVGVAVPYYFSGGQGKTGLFVAPVIEIRKGFGDFLTVLAMDVGADVGIKREWKPNVGQRFALTLRDGDSFADIEIGATAGITIRWP